VWPTQLPLEDQTGPELANPSRGPAPAKAPARAAGIEHIHAGMLVGADDGCCEDNRASAHLLERGHQQCDEHRDDRDNDKQFDQGETAPPGG